MIRYFTFLGTADTADSGFNYHKKRPPRNLSGEKIGVLCKNLVKKMKIRLIHKSILSRRKVDVKGIGIKCAKHTNKDKLFVQYGNCKKAENAV